MNEDRNLPLPEAAARLGISPHTLRAWAIYQRKLPFLRMGRRIMFASADLSRFEQSCRVEARPA